MPAKPRWYSRINDVIRDLEALPRPFADRATVEFLLAVGRRRAQQILAPCITERVGSNGLADRSTLIAHLRRLADGDDGYYERQRRRKVAQILAQLQQDRLERPQLLVEAPVQVLTHRNLKICPPGFAWNGVASRSSLTSPSRHWRSSWRWLWPLGTISTGLSAKFAPPLRIHIIILNPGDR